VKTKRAIAVAVIVLLVAIAPFLIYTLTRPRFTDGVIVPYRIGSEIGWYPVAELNLAFTSWNMTKQFHESGLMIEAENGSSLAVFRFTLKNAINKTVSLQDYEFLARLNSAYLPTMHYRGAYENGSYYYYETEEKIKGTNNWLGTLFPEEPFLSSKVLEANQTARGVLVYQILDGLQPTSLTLRPWTADSNVMLELSLD
jgi:hypothetical protein